MEGRIFDTQNVILVKIDEDDIMSFLIDKDLNDDGVMTIRLEDFTDSIIETIPEYVFAEYKGSNIPQTRSVSRIREAAKSIYKIEEYQWMHQVYVEKNEDAIARFQKSQYMNRGEFGEILLHLLLREFKGTVPLISKVYFKDSNNVPAHGFDAVHITDEDNILWLGESKLYTDAKQGLDALIEDLKNHIKHDYLREQFVIIKKNIENTTIPRRDAWIDKLSQCNRLLDCLSIINIPLLCTYQNSDIYDNFIEQSDEMATSYYETNIKELKQYFNTRNCHHLKQSMNILLLLFPIPNKKMLIMKLHEKLWHMQNM